VDSPAEAVVGSPGPLDLTVRVATLVVDGAVVAFAWFTVLAHLWDIANASVTPLVIVWLVTLPVVLLAVHRLGAGARPLDDARPRWLRRLAGWSGPNRAATTGLLVLAVVAALLLATPHRQAWRAGWALGLLAVVVTLAVLLLTRTPGGTVAADDDDPRPAGGAAGALVVAVLAAVAFALIALFAIAPNADDAYYVNRVTWIAQHGAIPDRDTMFGNNVFPALFHPVIATWETFAGALAHVLGVAGPSMDYLVLGPICAAAVPVCIWRAAVGLRMRRPLLGMVVAVAFLFLSARGPQWFGTMVVLRSWQTKELFAGAIVPLLYAYAAMAARSGGRRAAALLVAATVAGVGFTSSAAALAPVVLVTCGVAGYLACGRRAVWPVLAALLYPLVTLIAYRANSADVFTSTDTPHFKIPYDMWQWFVGDGVLGFVAAAALLVGFLGVGGYVGRLMLGAGSLVVLIALAPRLLAVAGPVLGGAPTAWRALWVAPLPLLAVGAASALDPVAVHLGASARRYAALAVAAVVVVAMAVAETPMTSARQATFSGDPQWDVNPSALAAARRLTDLVPRGAVVAGPPAVATAVALSTTKVLSLDARSYYKHLAAIAGPGLRMTERIALTNWLGGTGVRLTPDQAASLLRAWPVSAVCLARATAADRRAKRVQALQAAGFAAAGSDRACLYFVAPTAGA
jgi:hypothetical protein